MSATSELLTASSRILREDKRLLIFPLLSVSAEAVVLAGFVVPYVMTPHGSSVNATHLTAPLDCLLVLCYLLLTSVAMYFNAALFLAVAQVMNGEKASVRTALGAAARRLPTILTWALISSTVALLIRAVDRRIPIVSGVAGISWSCLSYLALPTMVFEGLGVRRGTKRATAAFRAVWREDVSGALRHGILQVLLWIPALVVMFFALGTASGQAILAGIAVCTLWLGLCVLVLSCLTGVFRVAVYHYAATGTTPAQFAGIDLSRAFH